MSAVTSIILVGSSHPNDGGIRPALTIHLEEGSRPALVVQSRVPVSRDGRMPRLLTMIPTLEHMLDDSILLAAYACGYKPVVEAINEITGGAHRRTNYLSMYDDFTQEQRQALYGILKVTTELPKITWCLFQESGLKTSLAHLEDYQFECEVTQSTYVRQYSQWKGGWESTGSLELHSPN